MLSIIEAANAISTEMCGFWDVWLLTLAPACLRLPLYNSCGHVIFQKSYLVLIIVKGRLCSVFFLKLNAPLMEYKWLCSFKHKYAVYLTVHSLIPFVRGVMRCVWLWEAENLMCYSRKGWENGKVYTIQFDSVDGNMTESIIENCDNWSLRRRTRMTMKQVERLTRM